MTLPVTSDYLATALAKERTFADMILRQHRITDLRLPTGSLVACDAFVFTQPTPFELPLPRGTFPVILSVADFTDDLLQPDEEAYRGKRLPYIFGLEWKY